MHTESKGELSQMSNCFSSLLIAPMSLLIPLFHLLLALIETFHLSFVRFLNISAHGRAFKALGFLFILFLSRKHLLPSPFGSWTHCSNLCSNVIPDQDSSLFCKLVILFDCLGSSEQPFWYCLWFIHHSSLLLHFLLFRDRLTKLAKLVLEVTCIWEYHHCDQVFNQSLLKVCNKLCLCCQIQFLT